jgi:hypothetical protein
MKKLIIFKMLCVSFALFLAFVNMEGFYRVILFGTGAFQEKVRFKVSSETNARYSRAFGIQSIPDKTHSMITIKDGKVFWIGESVKIANKDGLHGKTTLAEFREADFRVLAFGDSFTHWNRKGFTWPDLLQANLSGLTSKKVAVLNYGQAGYGILQMFDLAEARIRELRPDLAVFAFINDDLARIRWWYKAVTINGVTRSLLSRDPDNFDRSKDFMLIHPRATVAWARESMRDPDKENPVLDQIMKRYQETKAATGKKLGLRESRLASLDQVYIFNRVFTGSPFKLMPRLMRVNFDDFGADAQIVSKISAINRMNVPYLLLHLPNMKQIRSQKNLANEQDARLLSSLERLTNRPVVYLYEEIDEGMLREKISLMPHDPHPSYFGLKLYADTISKHVMKYMTE